MMSLFDPSNKHSFNQKFRKKRFDYFLQFIVANLGPNASFSILDIGGTQRYWESMSFFSAFPNAKITLVNLVKEEVRHEHMTSEIGNACDLHQYPTQSFDIVFSNSVIEHLYTYEQQQKMAAEVLRIGKHHFIQTPYYYFPIEPHWMVPFFQFLPATFRIFLTRNFSLGHIQKAATMETATELVNEVRLLSIKEMKALFPQSKIYKEYLLGLVKSITMHN